MQHLSDGPNKTEMSLIRKQSRTGGGPADDRLFSMKELCCADGLRRMRGKKVPPLSWRRRNEDDGGKGREKHRWSELRLSK